MNNFYEIVELVRQRLSENPLVNTITFGKIDEKDLAKKNIYPLVNIAPQTSQWTTNQVSNVTLQIVAVEQRDTNKTQTNTKFEGNDNLIDNLNKTYSILNDLLTWLSQQNNDSTIEMTSVSGLDPILFSDHNLLDGWLVTITLSIPNDISTC